MKNFRSFTDATFVFDSEYALISGPSGAGKTSIFMAIHFAMTGEGRKVVKYGKSRCRVELCIDKEFTIVRTKGPCRLIVNDKYEDAEAQALIDRQFPNWELGYVTQRLYRSFIVMSPADKLGIIEKMAFSGLDVKAIQNRCKILISERKKSLYDASNERRTLEQLLNGMMDQPTESKEQLIACLNDKRILRSKLQDSVSRQRKIRNEIESAQRERDRNSDYTHSDLNVKELMKQTESYNNYMRELKKLDKTTPHSGSSTDELETTITDMQSLKSMNTKLSNLNRYKSELSVQEQFKKNHAVRVGTCPVCSTSLCSWKEELMVMNSVEEITIHEAEQCDRKRIKLMNDIADLESLELERTRILELYGEPDLDPDTQLQYLRHVKQNDKIWESCTSLECEKPAVDVDYLIKNEMKKKAYNSAIEKLASLHLDDEDYESKLEEATKAITDLETKLKYLDQWNRVNGLRIIETEMEEKLPVANRLYALVRTAERMALEETLANINLRAGIYLSRILPDLTATLAFDSTDKIDLKLVMEDEQTDINALSGGEFARVVIAFALAMAEMNNVKTLLLDESFASLDAESTEIVLEAIKENYVGKVIVIAHQTTKGVFDQVIEL